MTGRESFSLAGEGAEWESGRSKALTQAFIGVYRWFVVGRGGYSECAACPAVVQSEAVVSPGPASEGTPLTSAAAATKPAMNQGSFGLAAPVTAVSRARSSCVHA